MKPLLRSILYRTALWSAQKLSGTTGQPRHFRLVIVKLDRLGDAVLALGAVKLLVSHAGPEHSLLIISPYAEALYRQEFPQCSFFVLPAFSQRFWPDFVRFLGRHAAMLKAIQVEKLVCLRHQPSDYLHAIAHLLSPRECHVSQGGTCGEATSLNYPKAVTSPYPDLDDQGCTELEAHRRLASSVIGSDVKPADVLPVLASEAGQGNAFLLVCPKAGDRLREYPPELMAEALRVFVDQARMPIHLCLPPGVDAAPWEEAFAQSGVLIASCHCPGSTAELRTLISSAALILAPESAPAHLATAMDKRGVFLLGGGHHGWLAPWQRSSRQQWLQHPLDCYQCNWRCPHPEAYCITRIRPQAVAQALSGLLHDGMPTEWESEGD